MNCKIGLEIHGYIKSEHKLFCDCEINPDAAPNTNICPVCTGQPGSKPKATNKQALDNAMIIGLMLNCQINSPLLFQRKHYSWPDSPNNYQRTMSGSYAVPVGEHGEFEGIQITEVHLEEDPAKWDPVTGQVDYNRAGVSLIEIVTEPDFTSSEQVKDWLQKLFTTLSYMKVIDKKSGIKCDVNVSIGPKFERVEIKNVNSQTAIKEAIDFEIHRQTQEKAEQKDIPMQTRTWDDTKKETLFMRSKETAQDYMFIPDPDIPLIDISDEEITALKNQLVEPPSVKEEKLSQLGVSKDDAFVLSRQYALVDLFEQLHKDISLKILITYIRREVVRIANYNKKDIDDLVFDVPQLHKLLTYVQTKKITDTVAQKILEKLLLESFDVDEYIKKEGLASVSDTGKLEEIAQKAIDANPKAVEDYKSGNEKSINFLVGQVMRETRGAASPDVVLEIIRKLI
ncbi:MAG: Asp-tRNA(Asn)/Glu-tRNA(Gln) amidotransferase subunit GatB [Candidatus Woesearchaeota archaeon]